MISIPTVTEIDNSLLLKFSQQSLHYKLLQITFYHIRRCALFCIATWLTVYTYLFYTCRNTLAHCCHAKLMNLMKSASVSPGLQSRLLKYCTYKPLETPEQRHRFASQITIVLNALTSVEQLTPIISATIDLNIFSKRKTLRMFSCLIAVKKCALT
jgi:hypothetical protein